MEEEEAGRAPGSPNRRKFDEYTPRPRFEGGTIDYAIKQAKPDFSGIMLPAKDSRQITSAKCYRLSKTSLRARTSRLENVTERIGVLGYAINQAKHNFEK